MTHGEDLLSYVSLPVLTDAVLWVAHPTALL